MEYDFSTMQVGDSAKLPEGRWGDSQRAIYDKASAYAAEHGVQFEVTGHEGSDFERGQYVITRTK